MYAIILLGLIGAETAGATSIEHKFRDVTRQYQERLRNANGSQSAIASAQTILELECKLLLNVAKDMPTELLGEMDLIALASASEQLKDHDSALALARRACGNAAHVESVLALVRYLCRANAMDEVENVLRDAHARFAKEDKLYLLSHIAGQHYRRVNIPGKAYEHLCSSVDAVRGLLSKNAFYATHLGRVLPQLDALAEQLGQKRDLRQRLCRLEHCVRCELPKSVETSAEIQAISNQFRAIIVLEQRIDVSNTETTLVEWLEVLLKCKTSEANGQEWTKSLVNALGEIARLLYPSFDGEVIENRLLEVVSRLKKGKTFSCISDRSWDLLTAQSVATKELVEQHRRLNGLNGTTPLSAELTQTLTGNDDDLLLIHICNPFSKSAKQGFQSLRGISKDNTLDVCVVTNVRGLAWNSQSNQFFLDPAQTRDSEQVALSELRRRLGLSREIGTLNNRDVHTLQLKYFPVNVVIDGKGVVRASVVGPEPEKIAELLGRGMKQPVSK